MKRICQTLQKPLFEVEQYPASELEWWASCFSIDDNRDQPEIKYKQKHVTVEESIEQLKRVLGS